MHNVQEEIMNVIKDIRDNDDGGLLGFSVREIDECYEDTGNGILNMFERYPEKAELLEEMLGAICCMNFDDIVDKMERERSYYNSL